MKRIREIALLFLLASSVVPLAAAKNSQGISLAMDARVGDLERRVTPRNLWVTEAKGARRPLADEHAQRLRPTDRAGDSALRPLGDLEEPNETERGG